MVTWRSNQTVVRRVQVKGRNLDPLAAQLRLDNLLQNVDLHPSWLPPSAIVCLRQLRDPAPRTVNLHSRNSAQSLAWQQAVSASVQEKIRCAVLPINADVPAEAPAIIFKDQAELLACLAKDWSDDRLGSRWWWRSLFKGQEFSTLAFRQWLSAPEYVPRALELLLAQRAFQQFVRKVSCAQAKALLREIIRCFELHELQSAFDEGLANVSERPAAGETTTSELVFSSSDLPHRNPPSIPPAPWHHLAPESLDQTLEFERECFIGVALTIRRAPATARSARFARATERWLRHAVAAEIVSGVDSSKPHAGHRVQTDEDFNTARHHESGSPIRSTATLLDRVARENLLSDATPVVRHPTSPPATTEFQRGAESPLQSTQSRRSPLAGLDRKLPFAFRPATQHQPYSSGALVTNVETNAGEAIAPAPSNSVAWRRNETPPAPFSEKSFFEGPTDLVDPNEARVETEFGGIFYLINLGIFLELYSDFTAPARNRLSLSIFDFIALVARRLLSEPIKDDPVWELLAQLAGRSELDEPGKGFEAPAEWRLPVQWLEAFPGERRYEWTTNGERLQVMHPAGFLLLDVPVLGSPAKQVNLEMEIYNASIKRQESRGAYTVSRSDCCLEQWLDWIIPYVRVRLCRALGIPDASDPALVLCAQRASIVLTDVHLDIFFALSEHPLEIRLGGLDRDPGWVPAAGRFVRFYYR